MLMDHTHKHMLMPPPPPSQGSPPPHSVALAFAHPPTLDPGSPPWILDLQQHAHPDPGSRTLPPLQVLPERFRELLGPEPLLPMLPGQEKPPAAAPAPRQAAPAKAGEARCSPAPWWHAAHNSTAQCGAVLVRHAAEQAGPCGHTHAERHNAWWCFADGGFAPCCTTPQYGWLSDLDGVHAGSWYHALPLLPPPPHTHTPARHRHRRLQHH